MVSFGAAPALIVYEWALKGMGNLGWIAAFVYVAGAALRLARFNVMLDVADKRWFTGIPSPAAAALVAGFVWIIDYFSIDPISIRWWAWSVTVFAGLTMVSNVPYYSFKTINLKKSGAVPRDLRVRARHRAGCGISRKSSSSRASWDTRCPDTSPRRGCGTPGAGDALSRCRRPEGNSDRAPKRSAQARTVQPSGLHTSERP